MGFFFWLTLKSIEIEKKARKSNGVFSSNPKFKWFKWSAGWKASFKCCKLKWIVLSTVWEFLIYFMLFCFVLCNEISKWIRGYFVFFHFLSCKIFQFWNNGKATITFFAIKSNVSIDLENCLHFICAIESYNWIY